MILLQKVKIDILRVGNVQLLLAISIKLNQTIALHIAKLPIRRVEVKTFTISGGTRSIIGDRQLTGQLLKRVFISLATNEALIGLWILIIFSNFSILVKWMLLVMDIVSMENILNLSLEVISILDLSHRFSKQ